MIIASRPLSPGDVVTISDPICHILNPKNWESNCFNCYESSDELKRCSKCQVFLYCSRECQAKDWKDFHKFGECNVYRKVTSSAFTSPAQLLKMDTKTDVQFVLRLYLLLTAKPELKSKKFAVHGDVSLSFDDLVRNSERIGVEGGDLMHENQAFVDKVIEPLVPNFDPKLFVDCIGKMNCFSICATKTFAGPKMGKGVYIELSAFNHSCRPNAHHVPNGLSISVRVMEPIDAGQEITFCFVDPHNLKGLRMATLKRQFNRTCNCDLCQSGDDPTRKDLLKKMTQIRVQMEHLLTSQLVQETRDSERKTRKMFLLWKRDLELFRQLNGNIYRPDHTVKMHSLLVSAIRLMPEEQEVEFLLPLRQELMKHWIVTFGSDHPFYEDVMKTISILELKSLLFSQ